MCGPLWHALHAACPCPTQQSEECNPTTAPSPPLPTAPSRCRAPGPRCALCLPLCGVRLFVVAVARGGCETRGARCGWVLCRGVCYGKAVPFRPARCSGTPSPDDSLRGGGARRRCSPPSPTRPCIAYHQLLAMLARPMPRVVALRTRVWAPSSMTMVTTPETLHWGGGGGPLPLPAAATTIRHQGVAHVFDSMFLVSLWCVVGWVWGGGGGGLVCTQACHPCLARPTPPRRC